MTLKECAQQALAVQDACNLSGVVHTFAEVMSAMCALGMDTKTRNEHAITRLFIDKLVDLNGGLCKLEEDQFDCYAICKKLAGVA